MLKYYASQDFSTDFALNRDEQIRLWENAQTIDFLARRYSVTPYTVSNRWSLGEYSYNLAIAQKVITDERNTETAQGEGY